jgi:hypothetical protein
LSSGSGTEWSGVRRRRLLQIGGRTRRAEREMAGGRLGRATRQKGNGRERERAPGTAVGNVRRMTWPAMAPGRRARAAALLRKLGRAAGRGRRGAAADRWGRAATGPGGQRWGVGGREKTEAARRRGTDRQARPVQCRGAV